MAINIQVWHETPTLLDKKFGGSKDGIKFERIPVTPISTRTFTTHVVPGMCGECIYCESSCPNLRFNRAAKIMEVNKVGCRGCGVCLPACPTSALQQRNSYLGRIDTAITKLMDKSLDETPVACNYCPVVASEVPNVRGGSDVRLVCTGRFEPALAVEAMARGYAKVLVVGCLFDGYPFEKDKGPTEEAIKFTRDLMKVIGLDPNKLVYFDKYVSDGGVGKCLQ